MTLHSCKRKGFPGIGAVTVVMGIALGTAAGYAIAAQGESAIPVRADPLVSGFTAPPDSARPRVWWHWMNGNVTKPGIQKDLEWMKRVGIGGVQNFDATLLTPTVVEQRLGFMTPEWKDAFRFAAATADRLGLELAIAASPGWSETGGPWVKPADGMKKLVWTQTDVESGAAGAIKLETPPSVAGPYHDLPVDPEALSRITGHKGYERPKFYADAAVFAYPLQQAGRLPLPRMVSNGKELDAKLLADGLMTTAVELERGTAEKPTLVSMDFDQPQTVRSATVFFPDAVSILGTSSFDTRIEAMGADDQWSKVSNVILTGVPSTVSFKPVTAKKFRFVLSQKPGGIALDFVPAPGADVSLFAKVVAAKPALRMAQLELSGESKVHQFEAKAGYSLLHEYAGLDGNTAIEGKGVLPSQVIDLTSKLKADGTLDWTPPHGRWRIVRLGYSLTGKVNHPATQEATGLEVDKYDGPAVRAYMEHYLGLYKNIVGADLLGSRGLQAIVTDSVEIGPSNWTPRLPEQFKRLRGYDLAPYLPALTGAIVGSRKESDRFLYDFRRTLGELFATEHYGTVADVAHAHGLKVYGESFEGSRPALGDDMQLRKFADIPMAALWTFPRDRSPKEVYLADMKGASSTAHVYGKTVVAAESLTSALSPWSHAPSDLKRIVDLEFAHGVNRPVIHTSVHQPVDDKVPGLSLMIFGQYFTRHETWAEMAKPWIDYIARSSYLLQQGRNVADVAYFHGEEDPLMKIFADVPKQYAYDFVNADMILNELEVKNGVLTTAGGARYRVLYLGEGSAQMTLPVLRRIAALVKAGATVVGSKPEQSPARNEPAGEYSALLKQLWPGSEKASVGKGVVLKSADVESALKSRGVVPDFSYSKPQPDSSVLFAHRKLEDGDIYFLSNRQNRAETIEGRFRVSGAAPEIWHADSGMIEPVSFKAERGTTIVPLMLEADGSVFVVFRRPTSEKHKTVAKARFAPVMSIAGEWDVAFQPGRGAPGSIKLAALASLSEHADPQVKYFSGVATYTKTITLPAGTEPGAPLLLDLGRVGDLAEVHVNGVLAGTAWHAPYRVDIGKAVREGQNRIEIKVANLWVNRLIGDAQPDAKKITFTALPSYRADAPLRPSGLIGPVQLLSEVPPLQSGNCASLAGLRLQNGIVESAIPLQKGDLFVVTDSLTKMARPAQQSFCRVMARLKPSAASDIRAEVFLPAPDQWNGKYLGAGNGGFGGTLAGGNVSMLSALSSGYAASATDMGHTVPAGLSTSDEAKWAHESPEKFKDWGYRATHETAKAAKELIRAYYRRAPEKSYFHGCSGGGREALMEALRYPDDYDGIVAGAPAAAFTRTMIGAAWNAQAISTLPGGTLPASKLKIVGDAMLAKCDAIDGLKDGVIDHPPACKFDLSEVQCPAGDAAACITAAEADALRAIYGGPRTSNGHQVFSGFPPGGEAVPQSWDFWIANKESAQSRFASNFFRWVVYGDEKWTLNDFSIDRDLKAAQKAASSIADSDNPDLSAFLKKGKLILYTGWVDAAISPEGTIAHYESIRNRVGSQLADNVRLFVAPGMSHCSGGPGAGSLDVTSAIDGWVDAGVAPEQVAATKYDNDMAVMMGLPAKALRKRPVCAWPKRAIYAGTGSVDDAASFSCR